MPRTGSGYAQARAADDWRAVYRWATGPAWEPPVYGLCADD
ncbi:hypothetical protein ACFXPX_04495 [Kitasatospora sp. NPDC059146]